MLGRLRFSTDEALNYYERLYDDVLSGLSQDQSNSFKGVKFERFIRDLAFKTDSGSKLLEISQPILKGLTFVTTSTPKRPNHAILLRSYDLDRTKYPDIDIWQAARATTANSNFFDPVEIVWGGVRKKYRGITQGSVDLVELALNEACAQFGGHRPLGFVLCLNASDSERDARPSDGNDATAGDSLRFADFMKSAPYSSDKKGASNPQTNPESRFRDFPGTYFDLKFQKIDEPQELSAIKAAATEWIASPIVSRQIDEMVEILVSERASRIDLAAACEFYRLRHDI